MYLDLCKCVTWCRNGIITLRNPNHIINIILGVMKELIKRLGENFKVLSIIHIYIYIYTHTHSHSCIHIYMYVYIHISHTYMWYMCVYMYILNVWIILCIIYTYNDSLCIFGKKIFNCKANRDFPGAPAAKTPCFQSRGPRFNPWLGN